MAGALRIKGVLFVKKGLSILLLAVSAIATAYIGSTSALAADNGIAPSGYYENSTENSNDMNKETELYSSDDDIADLAATSQSSSETKLYVLNSSYSDALSIPSSYAKTYQLGKYGMTGSITYNIISGGSVTVSSSGLVKPQYTVWYWKNGFGSTWPTEGATKEIQYNTGISVVRVSNGKNYKDITFNVINYAAAYVEDIEQSFINDNITSTMTDYDKLKAITKYVADTYSYSASYSSAESMIIYGGGDCWASCDLIMELCDKTGVKNHIRMANRDPGAGSGHRNVVALCDGKLYIADAGYSGTAPRTYSLYETSAFSEDGGVLYQYDGFDDNIVIPDNITAIGESGENVFYYSCNKDSITSISIPASVTYISNVAFAGLKKLSNLSVASGNPVYKSIDGIIYTKDGKAIYTVPNNKSSVTVKNGVATINNYCFYYNPNLTSVTIPGSVTSIGEGAFGDCGKLSSVIIPASVKSIGDYAFYNDSCQLIMLSKDAIFGNNAAPNCTIIGYAGSTAEKYAKANGNTFIAIGEDDTYLYTTGGKTYIKNISGNTVSFTGLRNVDGTLTYFKNGVKSTVQTLVKYNGQYVYVKDGTLCKATTLVKYNNKYFYVRNGVLCRVTTLAKYNGKYFYVKNGILNRTNAIVKYNNKYFYVKNGVLCRTTAIVKYNKKYYYVKNGVWSNKVSAFIRYNKKTYYVKNGAVCSSFSGLKTYKGHVYSVKNGVVIKKVK